MTLATLAALCIGLLILWTVDCTPTIVGCCCVNTPCCPDKTLRPNLIVVISGSGGSCDGSYPVTYNPVSGVWESNTAIGGCGATTPPLTSLTVGCRHSDSGDFCDWGFSVENDFVAFFTLITCDPLHLQYSLGFSQLVPCGCPNPPTIDVFEI